MSFGLIQFKRAWSLPDCMNELSLIFFASWRRLDAKEEGRMLVTAIPAFLMASSNAWYSFAHANFPPSSVPREAKITTCFTVPTSLKRKKLVFIFFFFLFLLSILFFKYFHL
eukprot:Phypoly_transcript_12481.p1 GENE.Phypoly_transcript_12481~~Phypoly_transcript_12481.p1  ORF type:complete len:112 (-),score=10.71 Phypoly_transcript_12481:419-754(-)